MWCQSGVKFTEKGETRYRENKNQKISKKILKLRREV